MSTSKYVGKGMGVILVVCSQCGFIFHIYSIGNKNNKAKFSGVPTPMKALSGFDGHTCPKCNRRVNLKPVKIQVMHWKKFVELYDIVEKPVRMLKPVRTMVEDQIRSMHDLSQGALPAPTGLEAPGEVEESLGQAQ